MLERLNHIAIVVPCVKTAAQVYERMLGAVVSPPLSQPDHGVTVVFVTLQNTKIELMESLGEGSPVANFLLKNPSGGMHHVCYGVKDIQVVRDHLVAQGARILGDGQPKKGAHGKPVLFLHPKDFCGTLIELEEV
jgi:methylmalonyl-CoA/ethylmalonyl-CoA epimerase